MIYLRSGNTWSFFGYYADINGSTKGKLTDDFKSSADKNTTPRTEVVVLGRIEADGVTAGDVGKVNVPAVNDAAETCIAIDFSQTVITTLDKNALSKFTSLESITFPAGLNALAKGSLPTEGLQYVKFTGNASTRLSADSLYLAEGGTVEVPEGKENDYLSALIGRDQKQGGSPSASTNGTPLKIVPANGDPATPATKQAVFGKAGDTNPIVVEGELAFLLHDDGTATCLGLNDLTYQGDGTKELIIPSKVKGHAVTTIGFLAFAETPLAKNGTTLKSITIPNSVTEIQYRAFLNWNSEPSPVPPAPHSV